MPSRLVCAILARNEAGPERFLKRVLSRCQSFADHIVVLDDGSTDDTAQVCRDAGAQVVARTTSDEAWGKESSARQELWDLACQSATGIDDWVLIVDADQEFVGDPRNLMRTTELNAWSFILYDCWNERQYRADGFWQGHAVPRPWLFAPNRVPSDWKAEWPTRGIHPGHCPANFPFRVGIAPPDTYYWLHWAYSTSALREAKTRQYQSVQHQLTPFERSHAMSILDAV